MRLPHLHPLSSPMIASLLVEPSDNRHVQLSSQSSTDFYVYVIWAIWRGDSHRNGPHFAFFLGYKYCPGMFHFVSAYHSIYRLFQLSVPPSTVSMNTRKKNKNAHPGAPDMTASQLRAAGVKNGTTPHRSKKMTKDQEIAALKHEVRMAQEAVLKVRPCLSSYPL